MGRDGYSTTHFTAVHIKEALSVRHRKDFFITECKSGATWLNGDMQRMDAVAIAKSFSNPCFTGYEVKVTRADFERDQKWRSYMDFCHKFSFACPVGLITKEDIKAFETPGVGLIWVHDSGYSRAIIAPVWRKIKMNPDFLLYIIMNRLDSDRMPFFTSRGEYWAKWLAEKERTRLLAIDVKTELISRCEEFEERALAAEHFAERKKSLLDQIKQEFGLSSRWDINDLKNQLSQLTSLPGGIPMARKAIRLINDLERKIRDTQ